MANDGMTGTKKGTRVAISCERQPRRLTPSMRAGRVALRFGVSTDGAAETILDRFHIRVARGAIVLLLGPSGSGKSTALDLIARRFSGGHSVQRMSFPPNRPVIDGVCPHQPLSRALELMSACGFGEARHWVRSFGELSDGQRFRARLARAVGRHVQSGTPAPLICDEFASGLHRRLAKSIAFNLRKLVKRHALSLVIASSHDDIVSDLQPDVTVRLLGRGGHEITERRPRRRAVSFHRRLVIEEGRKRDYDTFSAMHYRAADELGFVDKVYVLRERATRDPLGIVVYSHGPLELALRNRATDRRFVRNPARLNREMRIVRRVVVHPDVRGCGLGHMLLRRTMPIVGTRYVECLATMGDVNPVFEKAGMTRVGTCVMPENRARMLDELKRLDADPFGRDFVLQVCRRPRVRRIVAGLVEQWYRGTTVSGEKRVARQAPELLAQTFRGLAGSQPVYFLWQRPEGRA